MQAAGVESEMREANKAALFCRRSRRETESRKAALDPMAPATHG